MSGSDRRVTQGGHRADRRPHGRSMEHPATRRPGFPSASFDRQPSAVPFSPRDLIVGTCTRRHRLTEEVDHAVSYAGTRAS